MLAPTLQADIVLLDARMPEGVAAVRRALDMAPGMRIVVSSVRDTEDDIIAWAEAGVIGYIPSTTSLGDFVRLAPGERTAGRAVAPRPFRDGDD